MVVGGEGGAHTKEMGLGGGAYRRIGAVGEGAGGGDTNVLELGGRGGGVRIHKDWGYGRGGGTYKKTGAEGRGAYKRSPPIFCHKSSHQKGPVTFLERQRRYKS